jgi:zinc transport system substrate-binding protein
MSRLFRIVQTVQRSTRWLALLPVFVVLYPTSGLASDAPMEVFVSVLPQKYFVERVGGERVVVSVMVGPGQSPATYEPTPRQLSHLSKARLYFRIGVAFEDVWMDRISAANPQMKIIDTRRGITLRDMESVGRKRSASARVGIKDPHVWTNPLLVKIMAEHIRDALMESDPAHRADYEKNYATFAADLERLDKWIRDLFQAVSSRSFMVFHPSWGYFADAYGLKQIPIESAGKEPGARTLSALIKRGRKAQVKVIFVQQQFSRRTAETVAQAIGARVVMVDPLAENYLDNLRHVAQSFAEAMKE